MSAPRAVVVGAGIVGSAIAFRLAEAGVRVVIVERDKPACGTTATTFARLSAFDKEPEAYFRLNHAGMREHAELAAGWPEADWYHPCGSLLWEQAERPFAERVARFAGWGYRTQWRERDEVDGGLIPAAARRVVSVPEEGWVDATGLAARLLAAARLNGAELLSGEEVVGLPRTTGGWEPQLASGRPLGCDVVVNAAGAAAGQLAEFAGTHLELLPSRGLLADLAIRGNLACTVHTDEMTVRPAGAGRVMVRSDQVDRRLVEEPETTRETLCQDLVRRVGAAVPSLREATVLGSQVGMRVIPRGGHPSVGGVDGLPGYYQAVTHSGVILAPLIGRLLAAEITGGVVHELLAPYRPAAVVGEDPLGS